MWRSFHVRILLAMLAVVALSILLLFGVSYQSAVQTLENNYLRTSAENVSAQIDWFDEYMSRLYRAAVYAGADDGLRETAASYLALDQAGMDDVIGLSTRLEGLCYDWASVETTYLYLPEEQELLTSEEMHRRLTGIAEEQCAWVRETGSFSPVRFLDSLSGSQRWMYGYSRPLYNDAGERFASVCVGIEERTLRYTLLDADDSSNVQYYLIGSDGNLSTPLQAGETEPPPEFLLSDVAALSDKTETVFGASGDWLYTSARAPFSGVRLLRLTDRDSLRTELAGLRRQFFLLLALVMGLALLLTWVLVRWLYRPMGILMEAMEKVGGGDLSPCPEPEQPEEFRQLSRQFNQMIAEINALIDNLVDERTAKMEAELRALQYQIKPHFMYNTLNSIKYAAILQGNQKIGEQIGAFIALLEASISKKGEFLTLDEEILLLESYVSLQRYRYMDCFTVSYDLTDESHGCYVPRLLLQPIVENAILHGMDVKRSDNHIRVAALVTDGSLWIKIQDNGRGITPGQMKKLLNASADDHRQFTGIGVANIRERLRLYYGAEGGLQVFSTPGEGTKFVLRLPACYEEGKYGG